MLGCVYRHASQFQVKITNRNNLRHYSTLQALASPRANDGGLALDVDEICITEAFKTRERNEIQNHLLTTNPGTLEYNKCIKWS